MQHRQQHYLPHLVYNPYIGFPVTSTSPMGTTYDRMYYMDEAFKSYGSMDCLWHHTNTPKLHSSNTGGSGTPLYPRPNPKSYLPSNPNYYSFLFHNMKGVVNVPVPVAVVVEPSVDVDTSQQTNSSTQSQFVQSDDSLPMVTTIYEDPKNVVTVKKFKRYQNCADGSYYEWIRFNLLYQLIRILKLKENPGGVLLTDGEHLSDGDDIRLYFSRYMKSYTEALAVRRAKDANHPMMKNTNGSKMTGDSFGSCVSDLHQVLVTNYTSTKDLKTFLLSQVEQIESCQSVEHVVFMIATLGELQSHLHNIVKSLDYPKNQDIFEFLSKVDYSVAIKNCLSLQQSKDCVDGGDRDLLESTMSIAFMTLVSGIVKVSPSSAVSIIGYTVLNMMVDLVSDVQHLPLCLRGSERKNSIFHSSNEFYHRIAVCVYETFAVLLRNEIFKNTPLSTEFLDLVRRLSSSFSILFDLTVFNPHVISKASLITSSGRHIDLQPRSKFANIFLKSSLECFREVVSKYNSSQQIVSNEAMINVVKFLYLVVKDRLHENKCDDCPISVKIIGLSISIIAKISKKMFKSMEWRDKLLVLFKENIASIYTLLMPKVVNDNTAVWNMIKLSCCYLNERVRRVKNDRSFDSFCQFAYDRGIYFAISLHVFIHRCSSGMWIESLLELCIKALRHDIDSFGDYPSKPSSKNSRHCDSRPIVVTNIGRCCLLDHFKTVESFLAAFRSNASNLSTSALVAKCFSPPGIELLTSALLTLRPFDTLNDITVEWVSAFLTNVFHLHVNGSIQYAASLIFDGDDVIPSCVKSGAKLNFSQAWVALTSLGVRSSTSMELVSAYVDLLNNQEQPTLSKLLEFVSAVFCSKERRTSMLTRSKGIQLRSLFQRKIYETIASLLRSGDDQSKRDEVVNDSSAEDILITSKWRLLCKKKIGF